MWPLIPVAVTPNLTPTWRSCNDILWINVGNLLFWRLTCPLRWNILQRWTLWVILFHHAHHVGTFLSSWSVLQTSWTVVVLFGCIFSSFVAFRADVETCRFDAPITRVWACRWVGCFLFDKRAGRKWQTVLGRSSVPV